MKNFISVIGLEWKKLIFNFLAVTVIFAGSAIYSVYYPFPYKNDIVKNMPIAVVDMDKSDLSEKIISMMNNTESLSVYNYPSMEEAKKGLYERKVYGIVYIPDRFYNKVAKGESPTVTLFSDGSYFILYSTALSAVTEIVLTSAAGVKIQKMSMLGIPFRDALRLQSSVNLVSHPLYNPKAGYITYVAPAIYSVIVQQMLLLVILLVQAGGYEDGYEYKKGVSALTILLGKITAYFPIFIAVYGYFFSIGPMLFGFNIHNNIFELMMFAIPYGFAVILFGISLSYFAREKEGVFLVLLMTSIPFVMMSGFIWPVWMMPEWMQWFSRLIPSTSGVTGFLFIRQMGADISDIFSRYLTLWILVVIYFITSLLTIKWQMKQKNAFKE